MNSEYISINIDLLGWLYKRYNKRVHHNKRTRYFLLFLLLVTLLQPAGGSALAAPSADVTAYDLIIAMNTLRMSYGLPALVEDPIINAVAQSTAEIMAANQMSWHIGDVAGRLTAAGFGGGSKVWGTENFAVAGDASIDRIMLMWADDSHMIPAVNPAYCNVGAGTAKSSNGMTYYVLQAAYTSGKSCGEYISPGGGTINEPGGSTTGGQVAGGVSGVSQLIVPVKVATPDASGKIFHEVQAGQSFWSIAVTYKVTINDIEIWNNISQESKLQIGQRLFIPGKDTEGYATPTPVGMILPSKPDKDGKIVHVVESHQTLSTISLAYKVPMDSILTYNGIQADWPLRIGQELIIKPSSVTPSPTPRPLTPIEKLTPASDGKYYHTVGSGETLSWIASLYEVNVFDLMRWNNLNDTSILQPEQKLVLQVTPPATATPTLGPPTATPTHTPSPSTAPSATATRTQPAQSQTDAAPAPEEQAGTPIAWFLGIGFALAAGLFLLAYFTRAK